MNPRPEKLPYCRLQHSRTTHENNNQGASTVKSAALIYPTNKKRKLIQIIGYLAGIFFAVELPGFSEGLSQNQINFGKALSKSCKKKMPTETCDCYADRIAVRYNETQTLSIYQRMIKDKKSQEMFFLSTSPELLDCMDNQDK